MSREVKTLTAEDGYEWKVSPKERTGMALVSLKDPETGMIVYTAIADRDVRTPSHKAWAGARQSRSAETPDIIREEMGMKGVDPDKKLEETFSGYGHQSVADMARIQVEASGIPIHLCFTTFLLNGTHSGQEKSTRFQSKFGRAVVHGLANYLPTDFPQEDREILEHGYQALGGVLMDGFNSNRDRIKATYDSHFNPQTNAESGAMTARVLDSARYFLPFGTPSGFAFETSARDWAKLIATMSASHVRFYQRAAALYKRVLTPSLDEEEALSFKAEAPSLIRHTEPTSPVNKNLIDLQELVENETTLFDKVHVRAEFKGAQEQSVRRIDSKFTASERMAAQYLQTIWPGLDEAELYDWLHTQPENIKKAISKIIYNGHNNYEEMPTFAATTTETYSVTGDIGAVRDLVRHRAWERFVTVPLIYGGRWEVEKADQVIGRGHGIPKYLTDISTPDFVALKNAFVQDMASYYEKLAGFVDDTFDSYGDAVDYSFLVNLLPLGHNVDLYMHGDPKQISYMTEQRVRRGGHINYRDVAFEINRLAAESDPYMSGVKLACDRPDANSRVEFFDRS